MDKLPQRWSHLLPQKLFDAFKDDFYAGPGNWKSFLDYEHLLKEIYSADTGEAYPRPEPDAAPDNAASLNNRAISFLDLGKEKEAARMLEKSAAARHFDGTLNLALYRWRTGKIGGKEMLAAVEDLGKIYPSRSSELEETREQICLEACGQPQLPVYGWRERTGSEAPRIVRTDAKEMVVREALTDRNLASIAIPDFPGPQTTAIPDPENFLSDQALTMMKGKKTTLELLWDYEPTSPGGTQAGAPAGEETKTVALKGMRINGTVLEEYLGEENISAVVVPDHIETIGPGAFRGCARRGSPPEHLQ